MKKMIALFLIMGVAWVSGILAWAASGLTLTLDADENIAVGRSFTVKDTVQAPVNIGATTLTLHFDSSKLTVKSVTVDDAVDLEYHAVDDTLYMATYSQEPLTKFVLNIHFQPKSNTDTSYAFSADMTDACDDHANGLVCNSTAALEIQVTARGSTKKTTAKTSRKKTTTSSKTTSSVSSRVAHVSKRPTEAVLSSEVESVAENTQQYNEVTNSESESLVNEYSISTDSNTYKQNDFLLFVGVVAVVAVAVGIAYKMGAKSNSRETHK